MEENGFLPTIHFRSKNSLPELPEHTFSLSTDQRSRLYSIDWQQKSKNQLYGKYSKWNKKNIQDEDDIQEYERPAKRLSLSNSTASKFSQYRQNAEDNYIENSNLSGNNQKGPFQRSMSSFMFGNKSVESSSSTKKKFIPHNLALDIDDDILPQSGNCGSFQRSLTDSLFGMRSVEHSNSTSIECNNTLKNVQTKTQRRSDLVVKIAGPIEFLPTDYVITIKKHNDIRALATRSELAKFDDITLNNVMKRYRNNISSGSKPSESPKNIEITKEEWVAMMRTLDLSDDYSQSTMKILQQWQDIKTKVSITVGKIIKLGLNKKLIDYYQGKIQAIIHEKVLRVYGQQFQFGTILVLKNVFAKILSKQSSAVSHVTSVDLPNEGVNTGNSDKNDLTINKKSSESDTSTKINESQMKIRPMSDEDPETNNFMIFNMDDSEDISWMLDDLEEVVSIDY
ncbi:46467_t:CDS:2 [Gigaspora margarita]|uniref:46467_t:CDS:1 n=1 Tax=Gigaspora margarita TaxID=4874 RepID=A0ABN7UMT4_GIGMA|nr:46467_t:CDS:2 [Gigaspora margarita]